MGIVGMWSVSANWREASDNGARAREAVFGAREGTMTAMEK